MSIKYELSLWRDYPGSTGIREEKIDILAATGMDFAGRAQNIVLKREYTGKITLDFEIPVKYFDPFTGETVINPLCKKVVEKTKLKLWRDELWWNPFGGEPTYDEQSECTKYAGAWEQGRWYELIVNSHKEKRSKKQLFYSFTCNSLFMDELSRNGYSLQFVPNTDVMSANGMGTAHDLAERIVEGTSWEYIKTEVFPDYKEEFNAVTGETVKVPVSTDKVEFSSGLERYCYCYKVDGQDENEINSSIESQLKNLEAYTDDNPFLNTYYGFENGKLWWRTKPTDRKKDYVWGHLKTDISINAANTICNYDSGGMVYYINETETKPTGATTFSNGGINAFEPIDGTIELSGYTETDSNGTTSDFSACMELTPVGGRAALLYRGAEAMPLTQGEVYCIQVSHKEDNHPIIALWDAQASNYQDIVNNKFNTNKNTPVATFGWGGSSTSENAFENTIWFIVPSYVAQPHFTFSYSTDSKIEVQSIYIYQFKGYNKEIDKQLSQARSKTGNIWGPISNLQIEGLSQDNKTKNLMLNENGEYQPIWLGFGKISAEGYQTETYQYPIEFYNNGKYYDIYLPLNDDKYTLTKISSYNADKRRQISGEKSNRFSLLETVAKTFQCFTRFLIEHESSGHIKLDNHGRPIKRFTFVSELGRRNFNGFNYGVNLEGVERNIDANNLVTKCHIESISNQYSKSNLVSIQESIYNKLGMTFIYNFSYYLQMGLLDKDKFLKDYQNMLDYVHIRTQENLTAIEKYAPQVARQTFLKTRVETTQLMLNSYATQAQEELSAIAWNRFLDGEKEFVGHRKQDADQSLYQFPTISWEALNGWGTPSEWFSYQDDKVMGKDDGLDIPEKFRHYGFIPIPNKFNNRSQLAVYMARNILGSAPDFNIPSKVPTNKEQFWARGLLEDAVENILIKIDTLQTTYHEQQASLANDEAELEQLEKELAIYNKTLTTNNEQIARKIKWFENRYIQFITEGQWVGQDYIDADAYYLDATRAMSTSCMPKVSYTIGAVDLSKLCNPFNPKDTDWGKEFTYDVGDASYIKDEELFGNIEQHTMIANITSYIDLNKQDNIEMRNYETRFEELFQSVAAAVTSVQLNEDTWGRAANFMADGSIDETILQKSFNNNANLVIASSNNSVTQDNRGLIVRDNDTNQHIRLIGGGIFLSSDGGKTYKTGLTPGGISASLITAGQIDTSKIVIRNNDTPLFELNSQGLTAHMPIDNSFTRFDQFGIYSTDKAVRFGKNWWTTDNIVPEQHIRANSVFSLTRLGLDMKYEKGGLIFGTIGYDAQDNPNQWGLKVTQTKDGETRTTVEIDHEGNATFAGKLNAATGTFAGKLSAVTGDFSGKIIAEEGQIGGWHIDNNVLYSYPEDGKGMGLISSSMSNDEPCFYAGYDKNKNNKDKTSLFPTEEIRGWIEEGIVKCIITQSGDFKSSGGVSLGNGKLIYTPPTIYGDPGILTVSGIINAESGTIGGWTLKQIKTTNVLYSKGTGMSSASYYSDPIFYAGYTGYGDTPWNHSEGQDSASTRWQDYTKFYVTQDGTLKASAAIIEGTLKAGSVIETGANFKNNDISCGNITDAGSNGGLILRSTNKASYVLIANHMVALGLEADPMDGTTTMIDEVAGIKFHRGMSSTGSLNSAYVSLCGGVQRNYLYRDWTIKGTLYAKNGSTMVIESDERSKNTILKMSTNLSIFFDNLTPVTFKYNEEKDNKTHFGFIAQDVKKALKKANITDIAGLIINEQDTENEEWGIAYSEFIALNTSEIQKLKKRVAELESKLESLTSF